MKYREILNKIYSNYKKNDKFDLNSFIKFYKENNTKIVKFKMYDNIDGIIVDQNHLIFIYFKDKESMVFSKAHIVFDSRAIIYNCVLNNGDIEYQETIGRDFRKREDIYNFNDIDIVINDNLLDEEFEHTIENIEYLSYQKNKQKRLKI